MRRARSDSPGTVCDRTVTTRNWLLADYTVPEKLPGLVSREVTQPQEGAGPERAASTADASSRYAADWAATAESAPAKDAVETNDARVLPYAWRPDSEYWGDLGGLD